MQTFKTSKARENILGKIRKALAADKLPMPFPDADKVPLANVFHTPECTPEEEFASKFIAAGGKFVFCDDHAALAANLFHLHESRGWDTIACTDKGIFRILQQHNVAAIATIPDKVNGDAPACVTGSEMLIAQTGSIVLSSRQYLGRSAPAFYPVHIVVATVNSIVPGIPEAVAKLRKKYDGNLPSMCNIATGLSVSYELGGEPVTGIQGPQELFCFLMNRPHE